MRFLVLARGEVVGASDLLYIDEGMGIASGLFLPNERYIDIQPTICAHMLADGSLGNDDPVALERARENIKKPRYDHPTRRGRASRI